MRNDIINDKLLSSEDLDLLDVINASYLSMEDIKWLKSKRWFKRFLKIYAKELRKHYKEKEIKKSKRSKIGKEEIEVLDFTQELKIPQKEVIEILDFTKTIDISNVKDITSATSRAKKRVKLERFIWSTIIVFCSLGIITLLIILLNYSFESKKTEQIVNDIYDVSEMEEITTTSSGKEEVITTTQNETLSYYEKYANLNILSVNFNNLKNINTDTVGWLFVPGTEINYPFVHTNDNEYYLKHSFDKSSNKKGWVFLDFRNNIDNLSKNNVIYAHGLMNNQMFGSMRKVIRKSWYTNKTNHMIKISTPNFNQVWQVFSVYTIEPESYYITTDFNSDEEYNSFINTLKQRSIYNFGVDINSSDKILTLSSCYDDKKRMVLHAKLISNEKK